MSKRNRPWLSDEEYREFKKGKTAKERGARANARGRARAREKKANETLPHPENPIEHSSGDVPVRNRRSGTNRVIITQVDGSGEITTNHEVQKRVSPSAPDPQWVRMSRSTRRG